MPRPRKFQDAPIENYTVRLTAWHARKARYLGDGCMAEGIRRAIEHLTEVVDSGMTSKESKDKQ